MINEKGDKFCSDTRSDSNRHLRAFARCFTQIKLLLSFGFGDVITTAFARKTFISFPHNF